MNITDEQRQAMREVRIKQAVRSLMEIYSKNGGLINGNFTAIASKYGLQVRELRKAYNDAVADAILAILDGEAA